MQQPDIIPTYDPFCKVIREQTELAPSLWTFKSDPVFREILEHVSPDQARRILCAITKELTELNILNWDEFKAAFSQMATENDRFGLPLTAYFQELDLSCSPANFRYCYDAILLFSSLKRQNMLRANIVEVGGGYGGLAFFVHKLQHYFGIDIISYTGIDLPEIAAMQSAYAKTLDIPFSAISYLDTTSIQEFIVTTTSPKFFVSAYSFAELDEQTQRWYSANVISYCDHGMIIWNYSPTWPHRGPNPITQFVDKPLYIVEENPPVSSPVWFVYF